MNRTCPPGRLRPPIHIVLAAAFGLMFFSAPASARDLPAPSAGSAPAAARYGWIWQRIINPSVFESPGFGPAVAASGPFVVIGSPYQTNGSLETEGAAYVYARLTRSWVQMQELIPADGAASDWFGSAVAISGNTVMVQSPEAEVGGNPLQGAVYVFERSGTAWTQVQKLTASDGATSDYFGNSIAIDGDTAMIAAQSASVDGKARQGAVYVFTRQAGTWTQTQKLVADDGAADEYFGSAVSLSGSTAIVGASGATVNGNIDQGAAYVFVGTNGNFTQTAKLTADDGAAGAIFGRAVAVTGDEAIVGAPGAFVGQATAPQAGTVPEPAGAAYVFYGAGTDWRQVQKLSASAPVGDGDFGISVALARKRAVVGADGQFWSGDAHPGKVYLFAKSGGSWQQRLKLSADDPNPFGENFYGVSVGLSGNTVIVGAPGYDNSVGAAYLYGRSAARPVPAVPKAQLARLDGVPAIAILASAARR